jgi:hypothetical protein
LKKIGATGLVHPNAWQDRNVKFRVNFQARNKKVPGKRVENMYNSRTDVLLFELSIMKVSGRRHYASYSECQIGL